MIVMIVMALTASTTGLAKLEVDWQKLSQGNSLSEQQIIAGLKEALQVGTKNAVGLTGKPDGYFGNPGIKILMPEKLKELENGLRKIGYGNKVDEFVLSMNRAAERAAPYAKNIFWDAIKGMSIDDAGKIWQGTDTAATMYFKAKTSGQLTTTFLPVVSQATNEVGVTSKYKELVTKAKSIPFFKIELVDIDQYVVAKSLDGLFYMVGEEEKKIRKDPVARVTDLLKQVFGKSN
jgi:hypothetical protein